MVSESVRFTPFDYSDNKLEVYFEVADKALAYETLEKIDFVDEIKEAKRGYKVKIAYQQIPDIVRLFIEQNIAIYSIIPNNNINEH
jgi:hypothetical protein